MRTYLLLILLLLAAPNAWAGNSITPCPLPGAGPSITATDYSAHQIDGQYVESWFYMAQVSDGTMIYATLFLTDVGIGLRPGVEFSIIGPEGDRRGAKVEYKKKDLQITAAPFAMAIGPNRIEESLTSQHVTLQENGMSLDLRLEGSAPGWRPADSRLCFDGKKDKYHDFVIVNPRARLSGTLKTAAGVKHFSGWGYHDHTVGSVPAYKFSRRWFNIHAFGKQFAVHAMEFEADADYGGGSYGWAAAFDDHGVVKSSDRIRTEFSALIKDDPSGYQVPSEGEVDSGVISIDFTHGELLERMDVLANLGSLTRKLIYALVAKPVYFRFRANCDVKVGMTDSKELCVQETVRIKE